MSENLHKRFQLVGKLKNKHHLFDVLGFVDGKQFAKKLLY